jgi:hypothetical protein
MGFLDTVRGIAGNALVYQGALTQLENRIDEQLGKGREEFELELAPDQFPGWTFDRIPEMVADELPRRRPVTVVKVEHRRGDRVAYLVCRRRSQPV